MVLGLYPPVPAKGHKTQVEPSRQNGWALFLSFRQISRQLKTTFGPNDETDCS